MPEYETTTPFVVQDIFRRRSALSDASGRATYHESHDA